MLHVVEKTRAYLAEVERSEGPTAAEYTILVAGQLETSRHPLSIRRARQLTRNIQAARAAALATFTKNDPERGYLSALRASVPELDWGGPDPYSVHMRARRGSWAEKTELSRVRRGLPPKGTPKKVTAPRGVSSVENGDETRRTDAGRITLPEIHESSPSAAWPDLMSPPSVSSEHWGSWPASVRSRFPGEGVAALPPPS